VLHTNNLPALTTPQKVRCRYPVPLSGAGIRYSIE